MTAYFPQSQNESILITSQSKVVTLKLMKEKNIMTVQPMTSSHALTLFEKKSRSLDQSDDTAKLTTALKFMSLVIV